MESFEAQVTLPAPVAHVFDFIARPINICRISPPRMALSLVQAPDRIELGSRIEFNVQAFGLARGATHEITAFDEPGSFIERQVTGPFGTWEHQHLFEPDGPDRVIVIDRIQFESPGGMLRFVLTPQLILEQLEEGFDHRYGELEKIFGRA